MNIKHILVKITLIYFFICAFTGVNYSQRRGDDLVFQGLQNWTTTGIRSAAMGGVGISKYKDADFVTNNPAAMLAIKSLQFSFSFKNNDYANWENQDYRPNRQFATLPFYLDKLYTPDPKNNGKWDYDAFFSDSNYIVSDPVLGKDPFGEEASDWQYKKQKFAFENISIALPFNLFNTEFAAAVLYSSGNVYDYDRNETFLDPHIGYSGYGGLPERVVAAGDTVNMNWYEYTRKRDGNLSTVTIALGAKISDFLKIGISSNFVSGESDDAVSFDKIGIFKLIGGSNKFKFSYDSLTTNLTGISKYSANYFTFGSIFTIDKINIGLKIKTPLTFTREYNLQQKNQKKNENKTTDYTGEDKAEYPMEIGVGISFTPVDEFNIAFDYEIKPYSKTKYSITSPGGYFQNIPDQKVVKIGAAYEVFDFVTIMAGFRNETGLFIPDGAADIKNGPNVKSYNLGLDIPLPYGRISMAYEYVLLKYYDSYFSNTNYNTHRIQNIRFGYSYYL